jgi:hypothetical protein
MNLNFKLKNSNFFFARIKLNRDPFGNLLLVFLLFSESFFIGGETGNKRVIWRMLPLIQLNVRKMLVSNISN